jgi:hypothetical protein
MTVMGMKPQSRASVLDKRAYTVCLIVAVLFGLTYFRADLLVLRLFTISSQQAERKLPNGLILLPQDDSKLCQLHAIDSATGEIRNEGLEDCLDAMARNADAWKPLTNAQKAAEIRKSFAGR